MVNSTNPDFKAGQIFVTTVMDNSTVYSDLQAYLSWQTNNEQKLNFQKKEFRNRSKITAELTNFNSMLLTHSGFICEAISNTSIDCV